MPFYSYEAADRHGKKVSASAEAENEVELRNSLRKDGLVPIRIKIAERREGFTISRITSYSPRNLRTCSKAAFP
jgi:type II secretory pathway component PulF